MLASSPRARGGAAQFKFGAGRLPGRWSRLCLCLSILWWGMLMGCQTTTTVPPAAQDDFPTGAVTPAPPASGLTGVGQGQGIVFSPDLAARGNRRFYEGLGFAYWEGGDWVELLAQIRAYNQEHANALVRQIFLETHGSIGQALKLQAAAQPTAARAYASLGALQEQLGHAGGERLVLTACNMGRLFRPAIYHVLQLDFRDATVLPATRGVLNASVQFDPAQSSIRFLRRQQSRLEQTSEGSFGELSPRVRASLGAVEPADPFVVSNLFMQLLLSDPHLQLTSTGYVEQLSARKEDEVTNEAIFQAYLQRLDAWAAAPPVLPRP